MDRLVTDQSSVLQKKVLCSAEKSSAKQFGRTIQSVTRTDYLDSFYTLNWSAKICGWDKRPQRFCRPCITSGRISEKIKCLDSHDTTDTVTAHMYFVTSEQPAVRGHSITACTRWGEGVKNVCFCPRSGYKNRPCRGGQKMAKMARSYWMPPK